MHSKDVSMGVLRTTRRHKQNMCAERVRIVLQLDESEQLLLPSTHEATPGLYLHLDRQVNPDIFG